MGGTKSLNNRYAWGEELLYQLDEQWLTSKSIWYSCAAYVSVFSPLINYGLGHITGALSPWRYMYIVGGCLTILFAFVTLFFMDSDPVRAKHLNEREKFIAVSRLKSNNSGVRNTHFKPSQLIELLLDVKFWLVFVTTLCIFVANGPLSTFVPILIRQLGFSGLNSLLLVMPAGFIVGTATIIGAWLAGRLKNGKLYIVSLSIVPTLLSACLLWQLPQSATGAKLFGVFILGIYNAGYGVLMSVQIANTAGYTKRASSSAGLFVAYCIGKRPSTLAYTCTLT